MATPTIVPSRPRIIEYAPARAENTATARSNRLGCVRAAISGVTVCRGETNTISAVSATPSTVPAASATADPRSQL